MPTTMTPAQLDQRRRALAHPLTARFVRALARGQVRLFRLTDGRLGSTWRFGAGRQKPVPVLLLDHVGRRSGTPYTTPLLYVADGTDIIIAGSQSGMPKNPQWVANLAAHPETTVHLKREHRQVRARVAGPREREELWPRMVEAYADWAKYQATTDRVIPLIVLEPR